MITILAILCLLALRYMYHIIVIKPVNDEIAKEKHLQDSEDAAFRARCEAEFMDHQDLFNQTDNK